MLHEQKNRMQEQQNTRYLKALWMLIFHLKYKDSLFLTFIAQNNKKIHTTLHLFVSTETRSVFRW